ncbi:MAG: thioredoxin domain-containing protein [Thermoanaerobaculia bacterium]
MNRLAKSSSPYLLLHKDNPVDWFPWGSEALARARDEDKPIFLSVGYSTCYWCHVMERESFTDEDTAALMNRHFVNIKLDREERPDLDEIYMSATQILTQHGGWPNSVFLTPALEPYFAGTYFPPVDRPGLPAFRTVLTSMADAWSNRRSDVEEQAKSLAQAIRHNLEERPEPADEMPDGSAAERSLAGLERSFDPQWGGFGGAPKFPSPSNLFLLAEFAPERDRAAEMLKVTLDHMARGGIYDHLGGGFHRYATDREWNVPHFEKMLYDNGWLLEAYGREFERSGSRQAARVVRETAGFLAREMTSSEGAFWSALDAETDGHEGAFYVWTRDQLLDALGEEDYAFLAPLYGFDSAPFLEGTHYVLHRPERSETQARKRRLEVEELQTQMAALSTRLFAERSSRKQLLIDDKILTDWNGVAISGLATAGRLIGEESLIDQAGRAAEFLLETMRSSDGTLLHSWREGHGEIEAFLSDYAYLVRGLLAMSRARPAQTRWLEAARRLTEEQTRRLADPRGGFFAAAEADDVLVRSKDFFDGAMPSANAVAVLNLLEMAGLTGETKWSDEAGTALRSFAPLLERLAEPARMMTIAARRAAAGEPPRSSAVVGEAAAPADGRFDDEAQRAVRAELSAGEPGVDGVRSFSLLLTVDEGWHIYAAYPEGDAPEWIHALSLEGRDVELHEVVHPEADELPPILGRDRVRIHEGQVVISGRLEQTGDAPALVVSLQACDERRCLAPVEQVVEI